MFCHSLRRRTSFASCIPSLTSGGLGLRETQLEHYDICIPLNPTTDPRTGQTVSASQLRVLLLSPSTVTDAATADTVSRVRRFASLTGGKDLAIAFLLHPPASAPVSFVTAKHIADSNDAHKTGVAGIHAYSKLQVLLHEDSEIPHIPIFLLASLDSLADLLRKHSTALVARAKRIKQARTPAVTPFDLLQLCTANPPMSQNHAFVLSDTFPRLKDLAKACTPAAPRDASSVPSTDSLEAAGYGDGHDSSRNVERLGDVRDLLGEEAFRDVVDFWAAEWTFE